MDKAGSLPENQQKELAQLILNEIAWDKSFESSAGKLSSLAQEALTEYKKGNTKPFDF